MTAMTQERRQTTWTMYAQRRLPMDLGLAFFQIGRQGHAERAEGAGVSQVRVTVLDEREVAARGAEPGYWGWLQPTGANPLVYVSESLAELELYVQAGDTSISMAEMEAEGLGEAVQLRVEEIDRLS